MNESFLSRWARLKRSEADSSSEAAPPDRTGDAHSATAGDAIEKTTAKEAAKRPRSDDTVAAAGAGAHPGDLPLAGKFAPAGTPLAPIDGSAQAEPDEHSRAAEPELPPLESLTPQSDFRPFLRAGVAPQTRNAALKTLFSDPHFNVMDGLDVYIDDYNLTTPIAESTMRRLVHAHTLRLFDDLAEAEPVPGGSDAGSQAVSEASPDVPDVPDVSNLSDVSAQDRGPAGLAAPADSGALADPGALVDPAGALLACSGASDHDAGEAGGDDSYTPGSRSNSSPPEPTSPPEST